MSPKSPCPFLCFRVGYKVIMSPSIYILLGGDGAVLALVTLLGFASHQELGTAGARMLTTYLPLLIAWLLIAPPLRLYDPGIVSNPRQLWRPLWAMLLAAPLAGWLRAVWLNHSILPIFVAVLGGVSALFLLAWRVIYWLAFSRKTTFHG